MKKLMMLLSAVVFVVLAASISQAGTWSHNYNSLDAIDSTGHAVVSIATPSSPIVASSHVRVYLDSNGLWYAADASALSAEAGMTAKMKAAPSGKGMLYCFDSVNKFCAMSF